MGAILRGAAVKLDPEDTGILNVDVGRRLYRFRSWVARLTQSEMGLPMGLSQSHVTQMENGIKPLSIQSALALAHHFELPLDWLYRGDTSNLRLKDATTLIGVQNQFIAGEKPEPPPTWSSLAKKSG